MDSTILVRAGDAAVAMLAENEEEAVVLFYCDWPLPEVQEEVAC